MDSFSVWRVMVEILESRDLPDNCLDAGDEDSVAVFSDPLLADVWRAAVDRATFGLAVMEHVLNGALDAGQAAAFLDEMETDPDGLRDALGSVFGRG